MVLFSEYPSPRLSFVVQFLQYIVGRDIFVTNSPTDFLSFSGCKINYSNQHFGESVYTILPNQLIFSSEISPVETHVGECRGNICLFTNHHCQHGFDIMAGIFYLLSRYEEYLPHQKDMYGRFSHTESIAYKYHFLHLPLVNFWIKDFIFRLTQFCSQYSIRSPFQEKQKTKATSPSSFFIPTYDIDIAYSYLHQPTIKNIAGIVKNIIKTNFDSVRERVNVLSGKKTDPFDCFEWLQQLHQQYQLDPIYFFLVAEMRGQYDKNLSPSNPAMQRLIKEHASKYQVGLHPSWHSGDDSSYLSKEKKQFEQITHQSCYRSRQHYIRLTLPDTYTTLINNGIFEDYSMGYGSINGFRASVASPFNWFNLQENAATHLELHPFCFMDANANFEQHLTPNEAAKELQYYHDIVKQIDGRLMTIFHNHFMTTQPQWAAWRQLYADFLVNNFVLK